MNQEYKKVTAHVYKEKSITTIYGRENGTVGVCTEPRRAKTIY